MDSKEGYIVLTYEYRKIDGRWTAYCKELGTATFGRSLKQAEERLDEAVLLHLNTLEDVGERRRFFEENDIRFYKTKPRDVTLTFKTKADTDVFLRPHIQSIPELAPVC